MAVAPAADVSGKVLETLPAGRYVYLRLARDGGGEEWAAVLSAPVNVGDTVVVKSPFEKRDFDSPTLKRKFDRIWFGVLGGADAAAPDAAAVAAAHGAAPAAHGAAPAAHGAAVPTEAAPVAPPEGGLAITALRKDRAAQAGKVVTIRGHVTKYNEGILGKNWLHVSDGSAKDGTEDIAVTTAGTSAVGALVTVTGTVGVDRDFGAGYTYDVLVEDATVKAE